MCPSGDARDLQALEMRVNGIKVTQMYDLDDACVVLEGEEGPEFESLETDRPLYTLQVRVNGEESDDVVEYTRMSAVILVQA